MTRCGTIGRALAVFGLLTLSAVGCTPVSSATAQTFIEGSEDLPLAPTLVAVESDAVIFDSPSGRIVEAVAVGGTSRSEVVAFYQQTLPELGWEILDETRYRREGERLVIEFYGSDGALGVRFRLAPDES